MTINDNVTLEKLVHHWTQGVCGGATVKPSFRDPSLLWQIRRSSSVFAPTYLSSPLSSVEGCHVRRAEDSNSGLEQKSLEPS